MPPALDSALNHNSKHIRCAVYIVCSSGMVTKCYGNYFLDVYYQVYGISAALRLETDWLGNHLIVLQD